MNRISNLSNSSPSENITSRAIAEYKIILQEECVILSDKEATEQAICILNLFGALTEDRKEREDEA